MAYLECLQYEIPKDMKSMAGYKYLLVEEMEKQMKEGGIIMQKRGEASKYFFIKEAMHIANISTSL